MDYLQEAVVGEYAYFYIQAKDAFGNNQVGYTDKAGKGCLMWQIDKLRNNYRTIDNLRFATSLPTLLFILQVKGGDKFEARLVLKSDPSEQVVGNVDDHGDGTYTVRYTLRTASLYTISITLVDTQGVVEQLQVRIILLL